jgi:hypothetical protein
MDTMEATGNTMSFFTDYLKNTHKNVDGDFSTLKWLRYIDQDSLNMLSTCLDNLDDSKTSDEINSDEVCDMISLISHLASLELYPEMPQIQDIDISTFGSNLITLATMEKLRRKGLVEVEGDGKIINYSTSFKLTALGDYAQEILKSQEI